MLEKFECIKSVSRFIELEVIERAELVAVVIGIIGGGVEGCMQQQQQAYRWHPISCVEQQLKCVLPSYGFQGGEGPDAEAKPTLIEWLQHPALSVWFRVRRSPPKDVEDSCYASSACSEGGNLRSPRASGDDAEGVPADWVQYTGHPFDIDGVRAGSVALAPHSQDGDAGAQPTDGHAGRPSDAQIKKLIAEHTA
ncbi:hypothetical protein EV182_008219, partial [Spiromyces aspiralis]